MNCPLCQLLTLAIILTFSTSLQAVVTDQPTAIEMDDSLPVEIVRTDQSFIMPYITQVIPYAYHQLASVITCYENLCRVAGVATLFVIATGVVAAIGFGIGYIITFAVISPFVEPEKSQAPEIVGGVFAGLSVPTALVVFCFAASTCIAPK